MNPRKLVPALLLMATLAQADFKAHEWGTFTSLQGSDGQVVEGLEIEDDPLPPFVHSRAESNDTHFPACAPPCQLRDAWSNPRCVCPEQSAVPRPQPTKGFEFQPQPGTEFAVTQKMETPVLYFYSDREISAQIRVDFPGGVFGQYFPAPTSFSPSVGKATGLKNGTMTFDITVLKTPVPIPFVEVSNIYSPARDVRSNVIRNQRNEAEKFIFYRGLGRFDTVVRVTSKEQELRIENRGEHLVPAAFLIYSNGAHGKIEPLGPIFAGQSLRITEEQVRRIREVTPETDDVFHPRAEALLTDALEATGLSSDESRAMTNTWKKSYFRTPGMRVLYILSPEETETLLPMQITPRPDELIRTMVGRIEVFTDAEEQQLLRLVQSLPVHTLLERGREMGRFIQAKLLRVQELTADRQVRDKIKELLALGLGSSR